MTGRVLWQGVVAGTTGAVVMTVGEKVEQRLTGRSDSLTNDQVLEDATGVGAPPESWPRKELAVDLLHKAVYAFATGTVADALDVGPVPRSTTAR